MGQSEIDTCSMTSIRKYSCSVDYHSHNHHQIILPLNGILELNIETYIGMVGALQGAIIPANFSHYFRGVGDNLFVVVDMLSNSGCYPSDGVDKFSEKPKFFHITNGIYYYIRFIQSQRSVLAEDLKLSNALASLLALLLTQHTSNDIDSSSVHKRLKPALCYIEAHLNERIAVRTLAALSYLSVGRFHLVFQQYTGRAPKQYIMNLRMQRAADLLKEGQYSVSRIAAEIGYESQASFTHAFKRYFGDAPSRYRTTRKPMVRRSATC